MRRIALTYVVITAIALLATVVVVIDARGADSTFTTKEVKDSLVLSTYDNGFWYYWGNNGQLVVMQPEQDTVECPRGSYKYWIDRAGIEIHPDSAWAELTGNPPSILVECWTVKWSVMSHVK